MPALLFFALWNEETAGDVFPLSPCMPEAVLPIRGDIKQD